MARGIPLNKLSSKGAMEVTTTVTVDVTGDGATKRMRERKAERSGRKDYQ